MTTVLTTIMTALTILTIFQIFVKSLLNLKKMAYLLNH